jgi:hypothetical protein
LTALPVGAVVSLWKPSLLPLLVLAAMSLLVTEALLGVAAPALH